MAGAPRAVVQAQPAAPPKVGLLASARQPSGDDRWESGFTWESEACSGAGVSAPCSNGTWSPGTSTGVETYEPLVVWAADTCSMLGFGARDWKGRAQRLLLSCEGAQIENELWNGALARANGWANRYLSDFAALELTFNPVTPLAAMECLEAYLADCACGQQGMIHATRQTVTAWAAQNLLRREGALVLTVNDTIVVPGAGYSGDGPPDIAGIPIPAADGAIWAYATSIVDVRRGGITITPETFAEAVDRNLNNATFAAWRLAAASWDGCCHAAVSIDLPLCGVGGTGS